MGKPFKSELNLIEAAIDLNSAGKSQRFSEIVNACTQLICIGSGGSYTAAVFLADFVVKRMGKPASAETAMQFLTRPNIGRDTAIVLFSSSGKNKDTLAVLKYIQDLDTKHFIAVTNSQRSPLAKLCMENPYWHLELVSHPTKGDGYLATNSLVGAITTVVFCLGFNQKSTPDLSLIRSRLEAQSVDRFETLYCIYSPKYRYAAVDLESKYSESGLGYVLFCDVRQFCHGRHFWFRDRVEKTLVVAIIERSERDQIQRIFKHLELPAQNQLVLVDDPTCGLLEQFLNALVTVFALVSIRGEYIGIDPGRPGVPAFGSKIYNTKPKISKRKIYRPFTPQFWTAYQRKFQDQSFEDTTFTRAAFDAYQAFTNQLVEARFRAVVFDLDGTLRYSHHDKKRIYPSLVECLNNLIANDVVIGIATGRGKSAREAILQAVDSAHLNQIVIGYYNGACILPAIDEITDAKQENPVLTGLEKHLRSQLSDEHYILEARKYQITIEQASPASLAVLTEAITQYARINELPLRIASSCHSIDVVDSNITKRSVLDHIREHYLRDEDAPILCVGDSGQVGGNDHCLLSTPFSLSVDRCSASLHSCWNLSPPGVFGPGAVTYYMQSAYITPKGLKLNLGE